MGLSENRVPQFQQIHIMFIQTKAINWAYPIFWHNHIDISTIMNQSYVGGSSREFSQSLRPFQEFQTDHAAWDPQTGHLPWP